MARLIEDPELAAGLGRKGREHMERNYSAAGQLDALWNVILKAGGRR